MPQDRDRVHRRRHSRSLSPSQGKHKRSWQPSSSAAGGFKSSKGSFIPHDDHAKRFKSPPKFGGKREFFGSRRTPSPQAQKRHRPKSPAIDNSSSRHQPRERQPQKSFPSPEGSRSTARRRGYYSDKSGSRFEHRSPSPLAPPKGGHNRDKTFGHSSRLPFDKQEPAVGKKKSNAFSPPPTKRHRSNSTIARPATSSMPDPVSKRGDGGGRGSPKHRGGSIPQRKVSSSDKKKLTRMTLHRRFTLEDQDPFQLDENVTIAILRNPDAEPSEETTVKRVFDSSKFKMVHKKTEGHRPIFDREEIKLWRHDDNLTDDPDFERRLVRVKSNTSAKTVSDGLSRMSPDLVRKAFGKHFGATPSTTSPHKEPKIKLDPKPDPRYETKYRQQLEREGGKSGDRRDASNNHSVKSKKEGVRREDERRSTKGQPDAYDLRHALERRRSDREDVGFKVDVPRGERKMSTELSYQDTESQRRSSQNQGRSVVMGSRGGEEDRRRISSRGRGWRGGFKSRQWSPDTPVGHRDQGRVAPGVDRRSPERRQHSRYSTSPGRGRRAGYRGRGRGRDTPLDVFDSFAYALASPTQMDAISDSYKYLQHDDRDVSPKGFRGGGGRSRFQSRGFGSSGFRAASRGFRSRGRFRGSGGGGYRGCSFGNSRSPGDRRSVERGRGLSVELEWKHDMYDSLQTEQEQPHSTTMVT